MEKLANSRSFDYDVRSMLSYPPEEQLPYNEVVMVISGLPGSGSTGTWCGLNNGTHYLDGTEKLQSDKHTWHLYTSVGDTGYSRDQLRLLCTVFDSMGNIVQMNRCIIAYDNTRDIPVQQATSSLSTLIPPSIQDKLFTTTSIKGVTFTWSKGTNWSRGNM